VKEKINRDVGLDLARTLAIIGVILVHTRVWADGRFGVQLFFMLSGYLLIKTNETPSIKNFIIKRAFRLFPLYWFFLSFSYLVYELEHWQFFFLQFFLIQNLFWWAPAISGVWSISNEWLFSLIVIPLQKLRARALLLLILFTWFGQIVATLGDFSEVNQFELSWINTLNPFINLSFFLIGVAIKRQVIPIFQNLYIATVLLILLVGLGIMTNRGYIFLWVVGVYLILSMCLKSRINSRLLIWAINYIGVRTYSVFFIHFIVLDFVYRTSFFDSTYDQGSFIMRLLSFLVVFTVSAVISDVTWRLIERPSMQLAKRFTRVVSQS
jgi:peptidoglycan/LPS O-acetylase OafA/YrhL